MSVPNTFASATSAIPLANLDADFAYYDAAFQIVGTAMEVNYTFRLEDLADPTKKGEFVLSGITTGTTRQYTMPNASGTLATLANTSQTFLGTTAFIPSTASAALTIGSTTGTGAVTLGQSTVTQTVDIAKGATTAVSTKTVNIGSSGVSGSTTNINYGSSVTGALVTQTWNAGANNMRLDSAGNLGLGVAPSAWDGTYAAIQLPSGGALTGYKSGAVPIIGLTSNMYYSGSGGKYVINGQATSYYQNQGVHTWSIAPSGTAGNPITFTQAMTLDASGNLLVGTTSVNPAAGVAVNNPSTAPNIRMSHATGTASGAFFMEFNYNQSGCGSITQLGTSAVLYNTSSDYRLKNITGPITTSGAYIDSLKPVEGTWKADGSTFVGLIAHETQEVSRTTVATGTKDGADMQGMDYSSAEIIANLIAELQSLRARVAQLESK